MNNATASTADGPTLIFGTPSLPTLTIQGPVDELERMVALLKFYGWNTRAVEQSLRELASTPQ